MKAIRAMGRSLAWLSVALAVFAAAWVSVNVLRADAAEGSPQESLAPATGRWIDAGDVRMFVQQWVLRRPRHRAGAWHRGVERDPGSARRPSWPPGAGASSRGPAAVRLHPGDRPGPAELDYRRAAQAQRLLAVLHAVSNEPSSCSDISSAPGRRSKRPMRKPARVRQLVLVDPALGLDPDGAMPACSGTAASWPMNSRAVRTALVKSTATVPAADRAFAQDLRPPQGRRDGRQARRTIESPSAAAASARNWATGQPRFATRDCEGAISTDAAAVAAWARQGRLALIWAPRTRSRRPPKGSRWAGSPAPRRRSSPTWAHPAHRRSRIGSTKCWAKFLKMAP